MSASAPMGVVKQQWWGRPFWLNGHMDLGESWAYRAAPKDLGSDVRRVEIVRMSGSGRSERAHVRFVDGDEAGLQERVGPDVFWRDGRT
ncbi:hypothetical protein SAMN05421870_10213 [Streptomyces qinglanensis]|uniref:Uncharacterized protein n=1 Tax=Streptomyces qinglanensis TaxID=943816 RepID=A0A1H9PH21_9ACTN|nr:hypothetical protein SAMN05421870_10213 [Streptomyces qinglanensis]